jgi:2-polyprenyl-6-methoxyphenol hydroxylase-like FAD-dependent oxidoreductase
MTDFLICGGGPAGAAAAIVLAEAGASVHLVGRPRSSRQQFGESLSPGCAGLIRELGLWSAFEDDGHLPCYVHRSAWGSEELSAHDLIRDPRGHGWHIDRELFERRMLERARDLGVRVTEGVLSGSWSFDDTQWSGSLGSERLRARRVVDASGKVAWFARLQQVSRVVHSRQVALIAVLETEHALEDTASLVETVPEGWWYSAPIPGRRLAVSLFTDAGVEGVREGDGFSRLLARTLYTRARVGDARQLMEPRFVDAGSGHMERVTGTGWLAVGDAAMNFDPLSAHGITVALRSGIDGAQALLADSPEAFSAYEERLLGAFQRYQHECQRFYQAERRYPDAPYWAARRRL